ncbi:unnamed protein product, partial [Ixodes hexagonus]
SFSFAGCDTGLGHVAAVELQKRGLLVFAGCLDQHSEGAQYLKSLGIIVLRVDYLKPDTIEKAYRKISEGLNGGDLWAIVANAGVSNYGEVEWMQAKELQWVINVNLVGTLKLIGCGIPQIQRNRGRIAIVTGLQGRLSIPGMAVASATTAALCQFADGLRRELVKFGVQVSTIEPAFYRQVYISTSMTDHDTITHALADVTRRLPSVVKEEYGGSYLENFKFVFPKKLRKFSRSDANEVSSAVLKALLNTEANARYRCCSVRQMVTWAALELLPLRICDFFMVHQFTPRTGVAGNIRLQTLEPLSDLSNELRSHVETVVPLYKTPPIIRPGVTL